MCRGPLNSFIIGGRAGGGIIGILCTGRYGEVIRGRQGGGSCCCGLVIFLTRAKLEVDRITFGRDSCVVARDNLRLLCISGALREILAGSGGAIIGLVRSMGAGRDRECVPLGLFTRGTIRGRLTCGGRRRVHAPFVFASGAKALLSGSGIKHTFHSVYGGTSIPLNENLRSLHGECVGRALGTKTAPRSLTGAAKRSPRAVLGCCRRVSRSVLERVTSADRDEARCTGG